MRAFEAGANEFDTGLNLGGGHDERKVSRVDIVLYLIVLVLESQHPITFCKTPTKGMLQAVLSGCVTAAPWEITLIARVAAARNHK